MPIDYLKMEPNGRVLLWGRFYPVELYIIAMFYTCSCFVCDCYSYIVALVRYFLFFLVILSILEGSLIIRLYLNLITMNRLFLVQKEIERERQTETLPRLRMDWLLNLGWNFLLCMSMQSIINFFTTPSNVKEYDIYNFSQTREKQT